MPALKTTAVDRVPRKYIGTYATYMGDVKVGWASLWVWYKRPDKVESEYGYQCM